MENEEVKVKRFKDSNELVHVWANQGEPAGEAKNCPLKFDGPWLIYDGTLLGYVDVEKNFAVINGDHHERSRGWGRVPENGWIWQAKQAVRHRKMFEVGESFLRWMKDNHKKPNRGYGYGSVVHTADDIVGWLIGRVLKVRYENEAKAKKAKARRYHIMNYELVSEMSKIRGMYFVLVWMRLVGEADSRSELLKGTWDKLGTYGEVELKAAKLWTAKWEKIDRDRVSKHGAFGHESWEQRLARSKERNRNRLRELKVTVDEWEKLVSSRADTVRKWKEGANTYLPSNVYTDYQSLDTGRYVVRSKDDEVKDEDWRAFPVLEHHERTLLACRAGSERYGSGDEACVVTSLGARVPVRQAVLLLRLVERVRASGVDYTVESGDGEKHKFGYYSLTSISKDGDVRIGCHTITWPVIEEFRPRLLAFWEGLALKKEIVGEAEGEEDSVEATQQQDRL